jgi:hypothetical protein
VFQNGISINKIVKIPLTFEIYIIQIKGLKGWKINGDIASDIYKTQIEKHKIWKYENSWRQRDMRNMDLEIFHRMAFYSLEPTA